MSLFEQSPSRGGSRFGRFSSNMFFTRNTAKPKRVNHIEGLNGALICNVNDDPSVVRSSSASALNFSRPFLPSLESSRRAERLVPPTGFWHTFGVIQDTERWRQELALLANASGLGVEKDDFTPYYRPTTTADQRRLGARYSMRTGRFNEGTSKSRGRTSSKHGGTASDMIFNVPENEREMWMLQVLCQLLGTSSMEEVQSWLVSASPSEKERARSMINSALRGLKEAERTSDQTQQPVDLNSISEFIEKQRNEEKQASQKFLRESLNRPFSVTRTMNDEHSNDYNLGDSWTNLISKNNLNIPMENTTSYRRAYQNYNRRAYSSFDTTTNNHNNDEQIETTQFDQERQPSRLGTTTQIKRQTPIKRPSSIQQEIHPVESIQFYDEENENQNQTNFNNQQLKEKTNNLNNFDDNAKIRKIRQLENKLSRQEEESKKQINELHTKQSRLENALKLLTKQTSANNKRRQKSQNDSQTDPDVPVVNVVIETQKENDRRYNKQDDEINSSDQQSYINKDRDDTQQTRTFSGVWKPNSSTYHRVQGD